MSMGRYQHKFDEARFFLDLMHKTGNYLHLKYYLSAFMSSSRSLLQYAHKVDKLWYQKKIDSDDLLNFFRNERNLEIHELGSKIKGQTIVHLPRGIIHKDKDTITTYSIGGKETELRFQFVNWKDNISGFDLCLTYIDRIKDFILDGLNNGKLQP